MLQYIYGYITGKLKLKTVKNSLSFNGPAKESRLLNYCILNLLTFNEKLTNNIRLYANYIGSDKILVDMSN